MEHSSSHLRSGSSVMLRALLACALFANAAPALAQQALEPLPPVEELEAGIECVITAYYSPLPNQERYMMGDYEAEKRMEGNGTNGASGREVFVGMVAASKQYPFGTKVFIPGFGLGEVQDRGGAIKGKCRLDIWLGKGDLGLSRALAWGKRTVTCRIFLPDRPVPSELQQEAQLLTAPPMTRAVSTPHIEKAFYGEDLTIGSVKDRVQDLENDLKKLSYFGGTPDRTYDLETAQAVFAFQKAQGIVSSQNSYGAGYFGYQTRSALTKWRSGEQKITAAPELPTEHPPLNNLKRIVERGERGDEVRKAQELLAKLGYLAADLQTGVYGDLTRAAILKFQQDYGIVVSALDKGAGQLGPVTAKKLLEVTALSEARTKVHREGAKNAIVREAQEALIALKYLDAESLTGYFGPKTRSALTAFQLASKLIASAADPNAGALGPVTLEALTRTRAEQTLATTALKRGDRGDRVKEIQRLLAKLGYFAGPQSGFYGEQTEQAVRTAQRALGLIRSDTDLGAGMVGPVTHQALAAAAAERVAVADAEASGEGERANE